MTLHWRGLGSGLVVVTLAAATAMAQQVDSRLERLDSITRPIVAALVDSARAAALPTEPLVQRALEGAPKRASAERIVAAVRRLALDLGHARNALGPTTSPPELAAAVLSLAAKSRDTDLVEFRRAVERDIALGAPPASATAAAVAAAAVQVNAGARQQRPGRP